jgi:hypothetical protein
VVPHVGVHRGREDDAAGEGQISGGEEVVGQAVGEFREQIGGCGSDDEKIILLRDADMFDGTGEVSSALAEEKRSVMTLRPVSAAKVSGRMNSCAAEVIRTCTENPRSMSARANSAAL